MSITRILTGLTIAALAVTPGVTLAQSTTEKVEKKAEKTADKVSDATHKASEATKDTWYTSMTKIALYADTRVSGNKVHVETKNGVVTLRGKVNTAAEKQAAEEVAKTVTGVVSVKNNLQVVPAAEQKAVDANDSDLKTAIEKRIKQDASLKKADISVRVDKGVVTLTGDVNDIGMRAHASEVSRGVPGVRSVKNELKEKNA